MADDDSPASKPPAARGSQSPTGKGSQTPKDSQSPKGEGSQSPSRPKSASPEQGSPQAPIVPGILPAQHWIDNAQVRWPLLGGVAREENPSWVVQLVN
ncbi:hypothetical protein IMZ48_29450 [Candidatus Bathyarchaeota archaeon]|nr:hypothetical protein [Candidatus Bathyarchaeota archaeon]